MDQRIPAAERDRLAGAIAATLRERCEQRGGRGECWGVAALTEGERDNPKDAGRTVEHDGEPATQYRLRLEWIEAWGAKPARLLIRGQWPRTAAGDVIDGRKAGSYEERHRTWTNEITVDLKKDPGVIAKEIRRRLLPDYCAAFAIAREAIARQDDYARRKAEVIATLVAAGGRRSTNGGSSDVVYFASDQSEVDRVQASRDSVRFEAFSCPVAVALRILEAARKPARELAEAVCARCGTAISETQAKLSEARADDAEPWCQDCCTAELTAKREAAEAEA